MHSLMKIFVAKHLSLEKLEEKISVLFLIIIDLKVKKRYMQLN